MVFGIYKIIKKILTLNTNNFDNVITFSIFLCFFLVILNFALQIPQINKYTTNFIIISIYKSRTIYVRVCIWFIKCAGRTRGLFLFIIFSIYFAYFPTISLFIYQLSLYPVKLCLSLRFCYCLWFLLFFFCVIMAYDFG